MKIGFVSLGCPKNLVDSEVMMGLAAEAGHRLTSDPADAEVLVVNTCAFIDSAKQESIDTILEMAQHKQNGACRRLVVTGCLAERYREELRREIPEIDAVLGTGEVPAIARAIAGNGSTPSAPVTFFKGRPTGRDAGPMTGRDAGPTYIYDERTPRRLATPRHYAYVKVAEGCDYTCAFCIIPTLRGRYRSRTADSIVEEARRLADLGVRELLLISQDTTFYGNDRGERGALARLLRALDRIDGLRWIRMLYLYPTTVTDDTIAAMAECEKVCRYVDMPLQHASTPVLQRMKRPGSRESYSRLIARIRRRMPDVAVRSTFIAGFPGETEEDVRELEAFLDEIAFDHLGVFTYSHEEGTSAHSLDDDVPADRKRARRDRLMRRQRGIVEAAQRARIGRRSPLLVDGPSPEHGLVLHGRLPGQAPDIDPVVYLTDCDPSAYRPGDLIDVELVGAREYDLVARPVV
jgi:ribosomal protein S12 methylthiotransferase